MVLQEGPPSFQEKRPRIECNIGGHHHWRFFLPAVAIGACGIVLGVIAKKKNYPRQIDLTRYAYTNFEKVLHRLKAYLRGEPFCQQALVHELNILEDNVTDLCSAIDFAEYSRQYEKVFDLPKCILSYIDGDDQLRRCTRAKARPPSFPAPKLPLHADRSDRMLKNEHVRCLTCSSNGCVQTEWPYTRLTQIQKSTRCWPISLMR